MEPKVSIITLVYNAIATLQHSLPLIFDQDFDDSYEMIIIDSGSTDGSVEFIQKQMKTYPSLRLHQITNDKFHHAKTRNLGAELARGQYIVYLGGDALPTTQTWLANLLKPLLLNSDGKTFVSYCRQLPANNADVSTVCRVGYNYGFKNHIKNRFSELTRKDLYHFSSVCCCINKSDVGIPFFDEENPVNEDVTLSYRLINNGLSIAYVADSSVIHSHNYSGREIFQRYFDNTVTYSKIGIHQGVDKSLNDDGKRFLAFSLTVLKKRSPFDWLRFIWFTAFAVFGAKLGQHYKRLPRWFVRKCSKYGVA
jgi:glycosyltransferase involved in cell wall biosynthesis